MPARGHDISKHSQVLQVCAAARWEALAAGRLQDLWTDTVRQINGGHGDKAHLTFRWFGRAGRAQLERFLLWQPKSVVKHNTSASRAL